MIIPKKRTGWGQDFGEIKYLSAWSVEMSTKGQIRFYKNDVRKVVGAYFHSDMNDIYVETYPHNGAEIIADATFLEEEIRVVLKKAKEEHPHRLSYTITLEGNAARLVTVGDFESYYPKTGTEKRDELFFFTNGTEIKTDITDMFFCFELSQSNSNPEILRILCDASSYVANPVNESTFIGREFTYVFLHSMLTRELNLDTPSLSHIQIPTRKDADINKFLRTDAMKAFAEDNILGKVTVGAKGKTSEKPTKEKSEGDKIDDLFGKPYNEELLLRVQKQVLEKDSVNLSDIYVLGMETTLSSLPTTDSIIHVEPDMSGIVRRICIFQGQFHVVPIATDFDPEKEFGLPVEAVHVCSEDNFPHKSVKSLVVTSASDIIQ